MIEQEKFGIKDLYEATLKATNTMTVGNHIYQKGEVVFHFKELKVASLDQGLDIKDARGGQTNPWLLSFISGKDTVISFQSGIITKHNFALLHGANIFEGIVQLMIPYNTEKEISSENTLILDKIIDTTQDIFIYVDNNDDDKYTRITDYTIDSQTGVISFTNDYSNQNAIVNAYLAYEGSATQFSIGSEHLQGFFKFEGKAYYVDENNGLQKTLFISAPKVEIISDLQLYLGEKASPIVTNFELRAQVVKNYNGNKNVCMSIQMLDSDIDTSF